ncbi:hypothetical protein F441_04005 [Phytophthora nicotianae CJ01A1]|nr:hypothetical protein L916_03850 [Phytophthora nicotianae]ETP22805.1 hypothetical protein F441_04005 [Phytophthora nicotianae CJ01A1]
MSSVGVQLLSSAFLVSMAIISDLRIAASADQVNLK